MSMVQLDQNLEIPCSAIQEARLTSVFLVKPLGDDAPMALIDFSQASGETFAVTSGYYAEIAQSENPDVRKSLSDWDSAKINNNIGEFLVTFFPQLAKNRKFSDLDDEDIDEICDEFWDEYLSDATLAKHMVTILGGCTGRMVHHTSEYPSGNIFLDGMISIPSRVLRTSEFIDLKSQQLIKITKEIENYDNHSWFYGLIDEPFEFDNFEIFKPYVLGLKNTKCELRVNALHGSFLVSCVLKSQDELDGELKIIRLEEELYSGCNYNNFRTALNDIMNPVESGLRLESAQKYLDEFEAFNPPQAEVDQIWERLRAKDTNGLLNDAKSLAERFPYSHKPLLAIGAIFDQLGEFEKARSAFVEAIALSPNLSARMNLGFLLRKTGGFEEALPLFLSTVALDPFNKAAIENLLTVKQELGHATKGNLPFFMEFRKNRNIDLPSD